MCDRSDVSADSASRSLPLLRNSKRLLQSTAYTVCSLESLIAIRRSPRTRQSGTPRLHDSEGGYGQRKSSVRRQRAAAARGSDSALTRSAASFLSPYHSSRERVGRAHGERFGVVRDHRINFLPLRRSHKQAIGAVRTRIHFANGRRVASWSLPPDQMPGFSPDLEYEAARHNHAPLPPLATRSFPLRRNPEFRRLLGGAK
jgi:hypothetical protein